MLIYIILGIILLGLIISGKARTLVSGFLGLFIENVAKTPEGAEAVYIEAIDKAQEKYNKADDHLRVVAGQLDSAEKDLVSINKRIVAIESSCEGLIKAGKDKDAMILAEERDIRLQEKEAIEAAISKLRPAKADAEQIARHYEAKLKQIKSERSTVINDMKLNKQMSEMYNDMDELKNDSDIDKLLSAVKDGSKTTREKAVGAKVVHESKTSTKVSRIEADVRAQGNSDYIEQLKKKYNK